MTDDSTTKTAKPSNQELAATLGTALDRLLAQDSWERPYVDAGREALEALVARVEALLAERDDFDQAMHDWHGRYLDERGRVAVLEAALRDVCDYIEAARHPYPALAALAREGRAVLAGGDAAPQDAPFFGGGWPIETLGGDAAAEE